MRRHFSKLFSAEEMQQDCATTVGTAADQPQVSQGLGVDAVCRREDRTITDHLHHQG